MTAAASGPNPSPAAGSRGGDDVQGAGAPGLGDRAATIAELAAAIARVGPDGDHPAAGSGHVDTRGRRAPFRSVGAAEGASDRAARRRSAGSAPRHADARPRPDPPPDDPAGPAGDAPGDVESVAKTICLRLLTGQARSRSELSDALRRRGIPPDVAERVLGRFAEVGLVDDEAYAQAFVASKHRDRGLGRAALRTELRRKGIDGASADRALEAVDTDAERRRAAELVAKKLDAAMFAGLPAARRRLLSMLARRGYSASLAATVVNEALHGYVEPAELDAGDETISAGWDDAAG